MTGPALTRPAAPAAGRVPAPRRRGSRSAAGRGLSGHLLACVVPALAVVGVLSLFPLLQLVRMSLSEIGPATLIGDWPFVGTANLSATLDDPAFWDATRATAVFTVVLLAANLVLGYLAAVVLSGRGRVAGFVLSLMILVWALPPLVSGSVWKFLLSGDGGVNALLGLVGVGPVDWLSDPDLALWSVSLVAAWASVPFSALVVRGGLLQIPPDVLEAAALDGARFWSTTTRIVLPMLRPTLSVLATLTILYAFRSFDFVYVMTSGGPGTVTATLPFLAYQRSFTTYDFGSGAAVATLSMAVIVVLAVPYVIGVRREGRT